MCYGDKIYLVAKVGYEEFEVLGVYSTREKADKDIEWFKSRISTPDKKEECCVFEYTVDRNDMYPKDKKCYFAWVNLHSDREIYCDECEGIPRNTNPCCITDDAGQSVRFFLWAESKEYALKILNCRKNELMKVVGKDDRDNKVTKIVQKMFPYEYETGE